MNRRTFWFGVSLFAVIAAAPHFALAQDKSGDLPPNLAFGRSIALIRGHLLTGDELVRQHQWNVAYAHFTFPTEEIYGVIRDEVRAYHTPPFDGALKALARTVRTRSTKQYPKALEKVEQALAAADAGLHARETDWARFNVTVAAEVLKVAADEYDEALDNGRIVHAVGYRTPRGFVLQADRMIEAVAPQLSPGDAAVLADNRGAMAQIKPAFASLNPSDRPVLDGKAFYELVSKVDGAAHRLTVARPI
jgi:hypothetical protein